MLAVAVEFEISAQDGCRQAAATVGDRTEALDALPFEDFGSGLFLAVRSVDQPVRAPVQECHQVAALQRDRFRLVRNTQPAGAANDHVELGAPGRVYGHSPGRRHLAAEPHTAAQMNRSQYVA